MMSESHFLDIPFDESAVVPKNSMSDDDSKNDSTDSATTLEQDRIFIRVVKDERKRSGSEKPSSKATKKQRGRKNPLDGQENSDLKEIENLNVKKAKKRPLDTQENSKLKGLKRLKIKQEPIEPVEERKSPVDGQENSVCKDNKNLEANKDIKSPLNTQKNYKSKGIKKLKVKEEPLEPADELENFDFKNDTIEVEETCEDIPCSSYSLRHPSKYKDVPVKKSEKESKKFTFNLAKITPLKGQSVKDEKTPEVTVNKAKEKKKSKKSTAPKVPKVPKVLVKNPVYKPKNVKKEVQNKKKDAAVGKKVKKSSRGKKNNKTDVYDENEVPDFVDQMDNVSALDSEMNKFVAENYDECSVKQESSRGKKNNKPDVHVKNEVPDFVDQMDNVSALDSEMNKFVAENYDECSVNQESSSGNQVQIEATKSNLIEKYPMSNNEVHIASESIPIKQELLSCNEVPIENSKSNLIKEEPSSSYEIPIEASESNPIKEEPSSSNDIPAGPSKPKRRKSIPKPKIDYSDAIFQEPFKYGWKREVVYRNNKSSTKQSIADVYYYPPSKPKLRSMKAVLDYLHQNDSTLKKENFTLYKGPILDPGDPEKETIRDSIHRQSSYKEHTLPEKETLEKNQKSSSKNQTPEKTINQELKIEQKHWCPQFNADRQLIGFSFASHVTTNQETCVNCRYLIHKESFNVPMSSNSATEDDHRESVTPNFIQNQNTDKNNDDFGLPPAQSEDESNNFTGLIREDQRKELVCENQEENLGDEVIESHVSDESSSFENNEVLESEANFQDIEYLNKVIGIETKADESKNPPESSYEDPRMNVEEALEKLFYPSSVPEDNFNPNYSDIAIKNPQSFPENFLDEKNSGADFVETGEKPNDSFNLTNGSNLPEQSEPLNLQIHPENVMLKKQDSGISDAVDHEDISSISTTQTVTASESLSSSSTSMESFDTNLGNLSLIKKSFSDNVIRLDSLKDVDSPIEDDKFEPRKTSTAYHQAKTSDPKELEENIKILREITGMTGDDSLEKSINATETSKPKDINSSTTPNPKFTDASKSSNSSLSQFFGQLETNYLPWTTFANNTNISSPLSTTTGGCYTKSKTLNTVSLSDETKFSAAESTLSASSESIETRKIENFDSNGKFSPRKSVQESCFTNIQNYPEDCTTMTNQTILSSTVNECDKNTEDLDDMNLSQMKSFDETRNVTETSVSESIFHAISPLKKNLNSDNLNSSTSLTALQVISSSLKQSEEYKNLELQRSKSTFEKSHSSNSIQRITQKSSKSQYMTVSPRKKLFEKLHFDSRDTFEKNNTLLLTTTNEFSEISDQFDSIENFVDKDVKTTGCSFSCTFSELRAVDEILDESSENKSLTLLIDNISSNSKIFKSDASTFKSESSNAISLPNINKSIMSFSNVPANRKLFNADEVESKKENLGEANKKFSNSLEFSNESVFSAPYTQFSGILNYSSTPLKPKNSEEINSAKRIKYDCPNNLQRANSENEIKNKPFRVGSECLQFIFKYLTIDELLNAGKVCQFWNQISNSPKLWEKVEVNNSQLTPNLLNTLKERGTKYLIVFEKSSEHWKTFLNFLPSLKSLVKLHLPDCPEYVLKEVCNKCPQLQISSGYYY